MKKEIGVDGFLIGTKEDIKAMTGVSVILAKDGAKAGCSVRGSAPGTRETDLLRPEKTVDKIHAVILSGGSAFGLESSCGVMDYLEEQGIGFDVGVTKVPIVSQAVLFDLSVGNPRIRPNKKMGYEAAKKAEKTVYTGNYGAGCGATVGKMRGFEYAMKGGSGYHEIKLDNGLVVGAYVCVNACGEIYDGDKIIAGALSDDKKSIIPSEKLIIAGETRKMEGKNTTIGCIMTNADLDKVSCNKVADVAHNGYALSIRPVHTSMDGDTIFCMASNLVSTNLDVVCYLAQLAMKNAVIDAIYSAEDLNKIPSSSSLV